jgi:hypothetical protein
VYHVADLIGSCAKAPEILDLIATLKVLLGAGSSDCRFDEYEVEDHEFLTSFQGKMIVAHVTQEQHRQMEAVLYALRNEGRCPPAEQSRLDANQDLYEKLQTVISAEFEDMPLGELLQIFKERTGVTFFVDDYAFTAEDICNPVEETISLNVQNRSLETVLRLALRQVEETDFLAWNGVVYIAPANACEHRPEPFFFVFPTERLKNLEPERFSVPRETETRPQSESPAEKGWGDDFPFNE